MSLDQENPGVHVLSETLGDTELVGGEAWTSVTQRQDIPPSLGGILGETLGFHLQGLPIFTIWRRPRKAFSFLSVCAEVQITDKYRFYIPSLCQRHVFDLNVLRNHLNLLIIPLYQGQSYFSNIISHIIKNQQKLL